MFINLTIYEEKFNPYKNLKGFIMANHASAKKELEETLEWKL